MVGKFSDSRMIIRPADFAILHELQSGRNVASNLSIELDLTRQYVNERLTLLADYGVLNRVGPSEKSGLYELTDLGRFVLKHRNEYYDDDVDFNEFVAEEFERDGS